MRKALGYGGLVALLGLVASLPATSQALQRLYGTTTTGAVVPITASTAGVLNVAVSGMTVSGSDVMFAGQVLAREAFEQPFIVVENDFTAKVLTDAAVNYVLGSPSGLITYREELAKTTSSWVVASGVLDITADNTIDNEGVEIVLGDGQNGTQGWIRAQSTGACFTVNFTIALIAGTDQFVIGWRKVEAFQDNAAYAGYAEWSAVGINNVDGSVFSLGEVAGGGTLSDDSGVNATNASTHTLTSCIAATTGVPTAFLNGTAITMTNSGVAKTAATEMVPFISYLQAGGAVDANIRINYWEMTR